MPRRSSSPEVPIPPGQVHATRRAGSRQDATERVRLRKDAFQTTGWTLNISRGGARLVLEEPVELGQSYQVEMGVEAEPRDVRIVWAQDEADGQIVGVQFLDVVDGSVPPPPGGKANSSAPPGAHSSRPPRTDPQRPKSAAPSSEGAAAQPARTPVKRPSTVPPSKNRA